MSCLDDLDLSLDLPKKEAEARSSRCASCSAA
jgi:hypothetical protein